jgi:hypothetical protein
LFPGASCSARNWFGVNIASFGRHSSHLQTTGRTTSGPCCHVSRACAWRPRLSPFEGRFSARVIGVLWRGALQPRAALCGHCTIALAVKVMTPAVKVMRATRIASRVLCNVVVVGYWNPGGGGGQTAPANGNLELHHAELHRAVPSAAKHRVTTRLASEISSKNYNAPAQFYI